MENIQNLTLDIMDNRLYESVYSKQYDVGRQIHFSVTEDGMPYDLSGVTAIFQMKKPDNTVIINDCDIVDNKVIATLTDQCTILDGNKMPFQIVLSKGDVALTTVTGNLRVERSVVQLDDLESINEYDTLINLLIEVDDLINGGHIVMTVEKDAPNGVAILDENTKVPLKELYDATLTSKGITQLTDSVSSTSNTTAATPNSVKQVYDKATTNATNLTSEIARAKAIETDLQSQITTNKPIWDDKYTKNEVDNKFSTLETNIDWKEAVSTYSDIDITYPNPQDGWTVNVKDTDYTYRWTGSEWIAISANAIPKATHNVDGLLSKEDKITFDDANTKKHSHANKSLLDIVNDSTFSNLEDAYEHSQTADIVIDTNTEVSPRAGDSFTVIDGVTRDTNGHVETINIKKVTLPNTSVIIDDELSLESDKPVQNKVITGKFNSLLADDISYDGTISGLDVANVQGAVDSLVALKENKVNVTANQALVSGSNGEIAVSSTTSTQLDYCSTLTSNVQTQINAKQANITGGATTIASSNLTASRALVSNSNGKVAVSSTTSTQLGYCSTLTSNVQTQINAKSNELSLKEFSGTAYSLTNGTAVQQNYTITRSGYGVLGIVGYDTNNPNVCMTALNFSNTTASVIYRNLSTSTQVGTPTIKILYVAS